jgi:hypothetical protein
MFQRNQRLYHVKSKQQDKRFWHGQDENEKYSDCWYLGRRHLARMVMGVWGGQLSEIVVYITTYPGGQGI